MPFEQLALYPWDFAHRMSGTSLVDIFGSEPNAIMTISCPDALLHRQALEYMGVGTIFEDYRIVGASDITALWVDENLFSEYLPMFTSREVILVQDSELIGKEITKHLITKLKLGKVVNTCTILLLSFSVPSGVGGGLLGQLLKEKVGIHFNLQVPSFWQLDSLLEYWLSSGKFSFRLSAEGKKFLIREVNGSDSPIYDLNFALQNLELIVSSTANGYASNGAILSLDEVRATLGPASNIDKFYLAKIYAENDPIKHREFFMLLNRLSPSPSFDELRSFFIFMQNHLLKVAGYRRYLGKKVEPTKTPKMPTAKLNMYEQEIVRVGPRWNEDAIAQSLKMFGEWELASKRRDPWVYSLLKQKELQLSEN
ncbi:MAG: hypothetical protein HQK53_04625 [Oligoflexia bacterium]|nr:hypothetical protein [Oligoflexia bacterium]